MATTSCCDSVEMRQSHCVAQPVIGIVVRNHSSQDCRLLESPCRSCSPQLHIQANVSTKCSPCCSPERTHRCAAENPALPASTTSQNSFRNPAEEPGQGSRPSMQKHHLATQDYSERLRSGVLQYNGAPSQTAALHHPAELRDCAEQQGLQQIRKNLARAVADISTADLQPPSTEMLTSQAWKNRRVRITGTASASVLRIAKRIMREASSSSSEDETQPEDAVGQRTGSPVPSSKHAGNTQKGEKHSTKANGDVYASMLCAACRSPVPFSIRQSPSPRQRSPSQHRSQSPLKGHRSPHSRARADRVERASSTLNGLKDRSRKLIHRDQALTQELKGVLDVCISSSASGSAARDQVSWISQDHDGFSSVRGTRSPGSEWGNYSKQSDSQSHGTAPRAMHDNTQAAATTNNCSTQVHHPVSHAATQVEPPESSAVTQTSLSGTYHLATQVDPPESNALTQTSNNGASRHFALTPSDPPADAATQAGSPPATVAHAFTQVKQSDSHAAAQTSLSGDFNTRAKSEVADSHVATQYVPETAESSTQMQSQAAHTGTQVECPDSHAETQISLSGGIKAAADVAHAATQMEAEESRSLLQGHLGGMRHFSAGIESVSVDAETQVQPHSEHALNQTELEAAHAMTQADCSPELATSEIQTSGRSGQHLSLSRESLAFLLHSQSPVELVGTATQVSSSDGFVNNSRGLDILPIDIASQTDDAQQCVTGTATQVVAPVSLAASTQVDGEAPATDAASQAPIPADSAATQTSGGGEPDGSVRELFAACRALPGPSYPQWQSPQLSLQAASTPEDAARVMPRSMQPSSSRQQSVDSVPQSVQPYKDAGDSDRGSFTYEAPQPASELLRSAASGAQESPVHEVDEGSELSIPASSAASEAQGSIVHELDAFSDRGVHTGSCRSVSDGTRPVQSQSSNASAASASLPRELPFVPQFVKELSAEQPRDEGDAVQPDEQQISQTFLDINRSFSSSQTDVLEGQPASALSAKATDNDSAVLQSPRSEQQQNARSQGRSVIDVSGPLLKRATDSPHSYQQTLAGVARVKVTDPIASQRQDTNAAPDVLPHSRRTPLSSAAGQTLRVIPDRARSDSSDSDYTPYRPAPFMLQRQSPTPSSPLHRQTDAVVQLPSHAKPTFVSPRSKRTDEFGAHFGNQSPIQQVQSNQSTPRSVHKGGAADAAAWVEFGRASHSAELVRQAKGGIPRSPRAQPHASPRSLVPDSSLLTSQPPKFSVCSVTPNQGSVESWHGSRVSGQIVERRETDDDIVQEGNFGMVLKYVVYSNSLYEMDVEPLPALP